MTFEVSNRDELFEKIPSAAGWEALHQAQPSTQNYREEAQVPADCGRGKKVVILGAGVAGLTSAYELLTKGCFDEVTLLEANPKVGGRCLTLRPGDVLKEDGFAEQTCDFKCEEGEAYKPYLNAGPGRIPSSHKTLLKYLRTFEVPLEVYIMNSESNLTYISGQLKNQATVNRRLAYNTQGRIAEFIYKALGQVTHDLSKKQVKNFKSLLERFGDLNTAGQYSCLPGAKPSCPTRAGYEKLPGVEPGEIAPLFSLQELLDSEYWSKSSFYQPEDYLWQPTLFQPIGGMDHVVTSFYEQIKDRATIHTEAVVSQISFDEASQKYKVAYQKAGTTQHIEADYCLSNIPIPLLKGVLQQGHFDRPFQAALDAVYAAEYPTARDDFERKFLAYTTKVGWQAERDLWQLANLDPDIHGSRVPIFGGISWTNQEIRQIWYPSDGYNSKLGVLTGAYNFREDAKKWGELDPEERLSKAREQAGNIGGPDFAEGLQYGIAIAWQNMPYQKGGWAQWDTVKKDRVIHYNNLTHGNKNFFIIGDQLSSMAGWQEGAVLSAINAVNCLADPAYRLPRLEVLPDTRLTVEGI